MTWLFRTYCIGFMHLCYKVYCFGEDLDRFYIWNGPNLLFSLNSNRQSDCPDPWTNRKLGFSSWFFSTLADLSFDLRINFRVYYIKWFPWCMLHVTVGAFLHFVYNSVSTFICLQPISKWFRAKCAATSPQGCTTASLRAKDAR